MDKKTAALGIQRSFSFDTARRPLGGSSFRDACRQSDGALTVNGAALRSEGRCHCGCRLYTSAEAFAGVCCDHGAYKRCCSCKEMTGADRLSEQGECTLCFTARMGTEAA